MSCSHTLLVVLYDMFLVLVSRKVTPSKAASNSEYLIRKFTPRNVIILLTLEQSCQLNTHWQVWLWRRRTARLLHFISKGFKGFEIVFFLLEKGLLTFWDKFQYPNTRISWTIIFIVQDIHVFGVDNIINNTTSSCNLCLLWSLQISSKIQKI